MTKRILVAGGGIAGLATATLLNEAGYAVTLCERAPALGGRAKSMRGADGVPVEHSLRIITLYHQHLLTLMARVPGLLGNLVAVKKTLRLDAGLLGTPRGPRAIGAPWSPARRAVARAVRPAAMAAITAVRVLAFAAYFARRGVPGRELGSYLHRHLRMLWMCEARQAAELDGVSYEDYLGLDGYTPRFRHYVAQMPRIAVAARVECAARTLVTLILRLLFDLQIPPRGFEHLATLMMLDGPSSERLIEPWVHHLRERGVEILTGNGLADFRFQGDAIAGVTLDDGRTLDVDAVVAALPVLGLRRLAAATGLGSRDPGLVAQPWLALEWSNGLQIFLRDLPADAAAHFRPGVPVTHLDSPWCFVHVVQGAGLWRDVALPAGTRYVLSATWSSAHAPGPASGKAATACDRDELLAEALAQLGFPPGDHVTGWNLDHELRFTDAGAYDEAAHPPHLAGPAVDGRRMLNHAPLVYALPRPADGPRLGPGTRVPNLYLAGDFVETRFHYSSMEKAAEAGFLAAAAVVAAAEPAAARAMAIVPEPLPFGFLRRLDAWRYGRRGR